MNLLITRIPVLVLVLLRSQMYPSCEISSLEIVFRCLFWLDLSLSYKRVLEYIYILVLPVVYIYIYINTQ